MAVTRIRLTTPVVGRLALYVDEASLESFVARTTPPWSWLPRLLGVSAVTVGRHVAFRAGSYDDTTAPGLALIVHECVHVRQYREMGVLRFLLAYGVGAARSGFAHHRHPMEIGAIELQRRVRGELEAAQSS